MSKFLTVASRALASGLLLFLVACAPAKNQPTGSSESADPAADSSGEVATDVPSAQAERVSSTLHCDHDCPSGLALFVERLDDAAVSHFNRCTSFLVAKDIVATNSHCLSTDLRAAGALANGRISIVFGASRARTSDKQNAETVSVTQVLSATSVDPVHWHPDLAFLKLEREVDREPFQLSRMGIADKDELTAFVVDEVGDLTHLDGQVRAVTCKAHQNTAIAPQFTTDTANVAVARCALTPGNSGSPVIAADGKVHAVVHTIKPAARSTAQYSGFIFTKKLASAVLMTNISCAETPFDLGPLASTCGADIPSQLDLLKSLSASRTFDYAGTFAKWKGPIAFGFEMYEPKSQSTLRSTTPRAVCVKKAETWIRKSAGEIGLDSLSNSNTDVIIQMTLPLWGVVASLDEDERVTPVLGERDRAHVVLQFDLKSFIKTGTARVTQTMTSENHVLSSQPTSYDLPTCAK